MLLLLPNLNMGAGGSPPPPPAENVIAPAVTVFVEEWAERPKKPDWAENWDAAIWPESKPEPKIEAPAPVEVVPEPVQAFAPKPLDPEDARKLAQVLANVQARGRVLPLPSLTPLQQVAIEDEELLLLLGFFD